MGLFGRSQEEINRDDHDRGQKAGSQASCAERVVHDVATLVTPPCFTNEKFEEGYQNGRMNSPKH